MTANQTDETIIQACPPMPYDMQPLIKQRICHTFFALSENSNGFPSASLHVERG